MFSTKRSKINSCLVAALLILGSGCARAVLQPDAEGRSRALRPLPLDQPLPALSDQGDLEQFKSTLKLQGQALMSSTGSDLTFGDRTFSRSEYGLSLLALHAAIEKIASWDWTIQEILSRFDLMQIYGTKDWGMAHITGYYEPEMLGSYYPTERFSQALYALPFADELTTLPRNEIDRQGRFKGLGLEICYVDPIDAFFLQIQGSGRVQISDGPAQGTELILNYAGKNGHRYEAIGKFLKDRIAPDPITMQSIRRVLKTMTPVEQAAVFDQNPSFVYFRKSNQPATTAIGLPATAERTVATDIRFFPKGALAWVSVKGESRFAFDQDVGGAIKGAGRMDWFLGTGDSAADKAGQMNAEGTLLYLVPKSLLQI